MGFLSALARISLDMTVVTLLIIYLPGFPPYTTFSEFKFPAGPAWTGPLERNERLNLVDKLFENEIKGPESFAIRDGALYTGLISGVIVRIDPEDLTITPVAKIGVDCDGQHEEDKCGRPLGLAFTQAGELLVCDAVHGLYKINLDNPPEPSGRISQHKSFDRVSYEQLLSPQTEINGSQSLIFNSVVIDVDDETVYLSVSSTKFPLRDSMFELISDPSGRVIKFNIKTKLSEVLLDGLSFVNGMELSPDGEYLLLCETGRARILKYYLRGERSGQHEILTDALPGLPDNIKLNDRGQYYVGLISPRIPGTLHLLELISPHNLVRKFMARLIHMVLVPAKVINQVLPTTLTRRFEYWCGNLEPFAHLAPPYGLVIEVDGSTGAIVSSLHSTNGAVRFISEAVVFDRWIYFGSPYTNYLARVPKRLRESTARKSASGVTLGMMNDSPEADEASR